MTPDQVDAALELAGENLESVGFFGGEPLLASNKKILEYIISKTKGKTFSITTNGYHLEEFFEILSPLKFSEILVTLDGGEDTHNSRRFLVGGKPTYSKILKGIEKCLSNGMPICIRMNLESSNLEEGQLLQQELMNRFQKHGGLVSFEMGTIFGIPEEDKVNILTQLYKTDAICSPEEKRKRNSMVGRFNPIINSMTIGTKLRPTYSFCSAHISSFIVDPYGMIYACLPSVGKPTLSIGTYYPNIEFKEKSIYTRNIETISECRECVYSLLCGGGCPLGVMRCEDDIMKPECFSIKNQVHNILPRFYNINEDAKNKNKETKNQNQPAKACSL